MFISYRKFYTMRWDIRKDKLNENFAFKKFEMQEFVLSK